MSQNTLKEILANLHCGWGGRQPQIIKLSLRYVHLKHGNVQRGKFIMAVYAFFFSRLLKHTGFDVILFALFVFSWDWWLPQKEQSINSVWYSSGKMPRGKPLLIYSKGQMERNLFKLLPFLPSEEELVESIRDAGSWGTEGRRCGSEVLTTHFTLFLKGNRHLMNLWRPWAISGLNMPRVFMGSQALWLSG